MIQTIQSTLQELIDVLEQLPQQFYVKPQNILSSASIGQHTRHIIELFQGLLAHYEIGKISYDKRKRVKTIENDLKIAISAIQDIQAQIQKANKEVTVEYELGEQVIEIKSNYDRELMYNLEHCIHHQALIKVALLDYNAVILPENFGIAPSTIKFKEAVAQLS